MRLFGRTGDEDVALRSEAEPGRVQRREFVRVRANVRVSVTTQQSAESLELESVNLSGNGLVLARPQAGSPPLELDTLVWLEIPIDDGEDPIEARGAVVREGPRGSLGVRFDYIREADQDRLVRYLFRQERRQLKTKEG
jgi:c-di-GMP-binding flagellar brake protein YcgR